LNDTTLLVIGLGNPIMGDDGVGIYAVRLLRGNPQLQRGVEFKELSLGGLRLVEELLGYEKVFIIDSVASDRKPGEISELTPEQLKDSQYTGSPHGTNFATALALYRRLKGQEIPKTIRIFTIGINPEHTFNETLSPLVQKAALKLVESVANEIMLNIA
jgi:hydrogenase maturation protease